MQQGFAAAVPRRPTDLGLADLLSRSLLPLEKALLFMMVVCFPASLSLLLPLLVPRVRSGVANVV